MALRRPPNKILVNALDSETVKVVGGVIYIQGFGSFLPADVANCFKACPEDAVAKIVTHEVAIPDSCECPASYQLTIICNPDLTEYETNTSQVWLDVTLSRGSHPQPHPASGDPRT